MCTYTCIFDIDGKERMERKTRSRNGIGRQMQLGGMKQRKVGWWVGEMIESDNNEDERM